MDDTLSRLLRKIKKHPECYLCEKSITLLDIFISGYTSKSVELDTNYHDCLSGDGPSYGIEFEDYVDFYFYGTGIYPALNWASVIKKNCESEAEAFDKFYELFEIFLERENKNQDGYHRPLSGAKHDTKVPLYGTLNDMRARPCLYFRKKSLVYVYSYITGYFTRASECNVRDNGFVRSEFNRFVYRHYYGDQIYRTINWAEVILENSISDEEAFDKFFELLEEYKKIS